MTSPASPPSPIPALFVTRRVADIADSCRYAALAFLNGVLSAWGKKELAAWLSGPYADVSRFARQRIALVNLTSTQREIAPFAVSRVMREAHDEVIETLRGVAEPDGGVGFGYGALDTLVLRCRDVENNDGFIPNTTPRMHLTDRVLSLLAVDYLTRPEDYETDLAICARCSLVAFDAASRKRAACRVHSGSGIRFRASEPPVHVPAPAPEKATA